MQDIPNELHDLLKNARQKHLPKDQIILYMGDVTSDVFFVEKGTVKVYDINEQGNDKILHLLSAPALLPFAFFANDDAVSTQWFYTALTDCDVRVISVNNLRQAIAANAKLALYLTQWFAREVHEMLVHISSLSKTTAHGKITAALMFLAARHAKKRRSGWHRVLFPMSHQMIANMTGITRERATIVMKEFQSAGLVRSPRLSILEINFDKLVAANA